MPGQALVNPFEPDPLSVMIYDAEVPDFLERIISGALASGAYPMTGRAFVDSPTRARPDDVLDSDLTVNERAWQRSCYKYMRRNYYQQLSLVQPAWGRRYYRSLTGQWATVLGAQRMTRSVRIFIVPYQGKQFAQNLGHPKAWQVRAP